MALDGEKALAVPQPEVTAASREAVRERIERERYRLHMLFVRPTTYALTEEDWQRLNEWKVTIEEKVQRVREFLQSGEGIKSERRRTLIKSALGDNPREQDIVLFCIGDFLLDMQPKWPGKWTLTLQRLKAAIGGKHKVTNVGKESTSFVDTCLDQSVAVQALAHVFGIDGNVQVTKGGHTYWQEKAVEQEGGSIVDVAYGWDKTRGLFRDKQEYENVVTGQKEKQ